MVCKCPVGPQHHKLKGGTKFPFWEQKKKIMINPIRFENSCKHGVKVFKREGKVVLVLPLDCTAALTETMWYPALLIKHHRSAVTLGSVMEFELRWLDCIDPAVYISICDSDDPQVVFRSWKDLQDYEEKGKAKIGTTAVILYLSIYLFSCAARHASCPGGLKQHGTLASERSSAAGTRATRRRRRCLTTCGRRRAWRCAGGRARPWGRWRIAVPSLVDNFKAREITG
ncbi:hypothetical protein GGX14DRAFT_400815 [Mycena pura]|uniref:Uncharacterized protein n=1 Tax=Mycena pura TaxID=153505 RepID=A0AAD6V546_9AGAR|nr:hypothetical protein GGX14DRAFT_400815 [Mycena pura]